MKPFDEKFADNVRNAFDSLHEEMPPQAWADMKARLEGRSKARILTFWPFLSKAAGIALLVGMSVFWFVDFYATDSINKLAEKPKEEQASHTYSGEIAEAEFSETIQVPEKETLPEFILADKKPTPPKNTILAPPTAAMVSELPVIEDPILIAEVETPAIVEGTVAETANGPTHTQEVPTLALRPQANQPQVTNGNQPRFDKPAPDLPKGSDHENRLSWGITAGSMLAFAEQRISDGPGYSAGVTAEYALSPNVSLSSGGLLTYHQFELVNFAQADFANDYLPSFDNASRINLTGNNHYEMLALEIPLNAQFNVMETSRKRLYVGAGLSSLVFLQQRFSGTNTAFYEQSVFNDATGNFELQYSASTFEVNEEYGPLSRFDFGRLVNLSFGYVIRREKSAMVIEPFVKLPIGTLTSREINLGMGGISIKYRFSGN
jgi:hypothetical protein